MHALYHHTKGSNWRNDTNWLTDEPIRKWHGVTTNALGRVTELRLEQNNLNGTIPPEVGELWHLETLNFGENGLTGNIPSELGQLTNLESLEIHENALTGEIPTQLGEALFLTSLYLSSNNLSGTIPVALGKLVHLRWLDVGDNNLTGAIPPGLGGLDNLEYLNLWGNRLTGGIPFELGSLGNLRDLSLSANRLTGEIPSELGSIPNLSTLQLDGNNLSGNIPPQLGNLTNLSNLNLWGNRFTGEIPTELERLTNLEWMYLGSDTEITGCLPSTWMKIENNDFAELELPFCEPMEPAPEIEQPLPDGSAEDRAALVALYNATNGANWKQSTNWLSDKPVSEWHGVEVDVSGEVVSLNLYANNLRGRIPAAIGRLSKLQWLALSSNELHGAIPKELGDLVHLYSLKLDRNGFGGKIPKEIGNLENLVWLFLYQNGLSGNIPPELGQLRRLRSLELFDNKLTGAIPSELGNLASLDNLVLSGNELTGSIPDELGNLSRLERLNLKSNRLAGAIPATLGNSSRLNWLILNDNRLSGPIPKELDRIRKVVRIYLRGNRGLTGCIPWQLSDVPNNDFTEVSLPICERGSRHHIAELPSQLMKPPRSLGLDSYYEKYLDGRGIPIVASRFVPDDAFFRIRDIIGEMLADRPGLRASLASRSDIYVAVFGNGATPNDLPEFADASAFYGQHAAGVFGGVTVVGYDNVVCASGSWSDVFVHELAHAVHDVEPFAGFNTRLESIYERAMDAGLWANDYASTNHWEYFAEAVQAWFGVSTPHDGVSSRKELEEYDPVIASLVQRVFGDAEISSSCHEPPDEIQGRVTDANGNPLADIEISIENLRDYEAGYRYPYSYWTNKDGTFRIEVPDGSYYLFVYKSYCQEVGAYGNDGFTTNSNDVAVITVQGEDVKGIHVRIEEDLDQMSAIDAC